MIYVYIVEIMCTAGVSLPRPGSDLLTVCEIMIRKVHHMKEDCRHWVSALAKLVFILLNFKQRRDKIMYYPNVISILLTFMMTYGR